MDRIYYNKNNIKDGLYITEEMSRSKGETYHG